MDAFTYELVSDTLDLSDWTDEQKDERVLLVLAEVCKVYAADRGIDDVVEAAFEMFEGKHIVVGMNADGSTLRYTVQTQEG